MTPDEIRQLRQRFDLSQRELASLLNVNRMTVSRWERGEFEPPQDKVAMMKQLRERGKTEGQEFVESLLTVAAGGAFVLLLSKLFGGE